MNAVEELLLHIQTEYSRVSFSDGSFYDNSLLRHLSSRCVSSFSILVQFFQVDCDFSTNDIHQKDRYEEKVKTVDVTFFLDVI